MILIIGGAYQGKHDYVRERYPDWPTRLVDNLHLWVRERLEAGEDPVELLRARLPDYRDSIVLCDDISCGVVPLSSEARQWREATGRCATLLAKEADRVVRLFCGIPTQLK